MPCVSLGSRKIYKARIMKSAEESVKTAMPVCAADLSAASQETENLVNIAVVAEEVLQSEQILSNPQTVPITSAGIKAPKQPLYYKVQTNLLRPAKAKSLRRAVVKAINNPAHKAQRPTQPAAQTTKSDIPQILLDGTKVQIRAHRTPISRVGQKIISAPSAKTKKSPHFFQRTQKLAQQASEKVAITARQMRRRPSRAELINAESKLGSTIFGPVPAGHRREFFHDRENVWIWHEDWLDREQHARQLTVRYEVRPSGVYKKISAGKYIQLKGAELENFRQATKVYLHIIKQRLYAHAK